VYDLIGDIHGHADPLERLLTKLGYREHDNVYRHPERKVIFLGDFIDRGPKIKRVLEIARSMVDADAALAVLGNHELNAIAYATEDPDVPREYMRPHTNEKMHQHSATLQQVPSENEWNTWLDWFRTLPVALDLDGLRVVHACWDDALISLIHQARTGVSTITNEFIHDAYRKGTDLFDAVEVALKGREAELPDGLSFLDKGGSERTAIRTRWYLPAEGMTYREYALQADVVECDAVVTEKVQNEAVPYPADAPPVFLGHYWLRADAPTKLASNVACLDYSVAKHGFLCAYRWNGEQTLSDANFAW